MVIIHEKYILQCFNFSIRHFEGFQGEIFEQIFIFADVPTVGGTCGQGTMLPFAWLLFGAQSFVCGTKQLKTPLWGGRNPFCFLKRTLDLSILD